MRNRLLKSILAFIVFVLSVSSISAFAQCASGNAMYFDGSPIGRYIQPIVPSNGIGDNFTIEFWANPTGTITPGMNASNAGFAGTSGQRYAVFPDWYNNTTQAGVGVSVGTNGVAVIEHAHGHMPASLVHYAPISGWTHIAIVYTNRTPSLYINNQHISPTHGSVQSARAVYPSSNVGNFIVGGFSFQTYGPYMGYIDDFRIWGVSLPKNTMGDWYNRELNTSHPNWGSLERYWNFNEASGIHAWDASGQSRYGTLVNNVARDISAAAFHSYTFYADADTDGFGDANNPITICSATAPSNYVSNKTDCNDNDVNEHPGQIWYIDEDGDGYGTDLNYTQCFRPTNGFLFSELTATRGDCDDESSSVQVCPTTKDGLYALTLGGQGTISKLDINSNILTAEYYFSSNGMNCGYGNQMTIGIDGKMFGTTLNGGKGFGVIYSFDPVTGVYTTLKEFNITDGQHPCGKLLRLNGKLYGMTSRGGNFDKGVIFSFDPVNSFYTILKNFEGINGAMPYGNLTQGADGKLYGMTNSGGINGKGVIFSLDLLTSNFTKLKDFDAGSGMFPYGDLTLTSNGKLFGMTREGGVDGSGVLFSFDPVSLIYSKLKDFNATIGFYPMGSLIEATNGKLYGMTTFGGSMLKGTIFSFEVANSTFTKLKDLEEVTGAHPYGSFFQSSNGMLYGLTNVGGNYGNGVLFSFDISLNLYAKQKDLEYQSGTTPFGNVIQHSNGKLYGTTFVGGTYRSGGIFSFDPVENIYTKIFDFGGIDAKYPVASLIQGQDKKLYGTTREGGLNNSGGIFSYDLTSSTYSLLQSFGIGLYPAGKIIEDNDGKFYGMTKNGGTHSLGTLFSFDRTTQGVTTLLNFYSSIGGQPNGSLFKSSNGKFYGMTFIGGVADRGVLFSFEPVTSTYSKVKEFTSTDGCYPVGDLIEINGKLYGMTTSGGAYNLGVIFSFDLATSTYSVLKHFDGATGNSGYGSLIYGKDGKLYGMTVFGGINNCGVIFSLDIVNSTYIVLKHFSIQDGFYPYGNLIQAKNEKLYGMTSMGGLHNKGVTFSFDLTTAIYTKLKDFNHINGAYPYYGSAFLEIKDFDCDPQNNTPIITANGPTEICPGSSVTLTSSDADTYLWSNGETTQSIVVNTSGNYTVTIGYGNSCTATSAATTVTVSDEVDPVVVTQNITVQLNNNGQVTITPADINAGSTDNCSIPPNGYSLDRSQFTCNNLGPNNVTLTVTDASGNTATGNAVVTVENISTPAIVISIANPTVPICENGSATFSASLSNAGTNPLLSWKKNGSFISGGSATNVTIPNLHNNDKITCQLLAMVPCSTFVNSNEINIATSSASPTISISSNINTVCEGGDVIFTATYSNGGTSPAFEWMVDGVVMTSGSQSTITFSSELYDGAVVSCRMTSNEPCANPTVVTSNAVTVNVLVPTYAGAGVNETIFGNSLNLYGNAPAANETGVWTIVSGNGGVLTNPSLHDSKFTGVTGETYILKWTITHPDCGATDDEVTYTFSPVTGPLQGKLYGMTKEGGTNGFGVIYEYDAISETLTKKYDFESEILGRNPWGSLVQAFNGKLYGLATDGGIHEGGTLFEFDPVTSTYTKKHDLNTSLGLYPTGALIKGPGGKLFGLTKMGGNADRGTIFSYDPETNVIAKLYDFTSNDGKEPVASLLYYDGYLYGTTEFGGAYNLGTVFRYSPGSTNIEILNHLNGPDGATPGGSLVEKDGHLYGTTLLGGTHNKGVIFEIEPAFGGFTKKLDLGEGNPYGDLLDFNGTFYGLGPHGGTNNSGVLYSYIPNGPGVYGGGIPASHSFSGVDGATPRGSLKLFNNRFYGVTHFGGSLNKGVLFEYHPGNRVLRKKVDFNITNGALPEFSTLIELEEVPPANISSNITIICPGSQITLQENPLTTGNNYQWYKDGIALPGATASTYSASEAGDYHLRVTNNKGYYSNSAVITISEPIYAEAGADRIVPGTHTYLRGNQEENTLGNWSILAGSGGIIQTLANGDIKLKGQVDETYTLRWSLSSGGCSTVDDVEVSFIPIPFPYTGILYGMTNSGGTNGGGVIYEYNTLTETYTVKYSFNCATGGCNPYGSLLQTKNGKLFGMTAVGGQYGKGVIFEFNPTTNQYINRHFFFNDNGEHPQGSLLEGADGKLYGLTTLGGNYGKGVLFAYDPEGMSLTVKHHFNGSTGANPNGTLTLAANGHMYGTTVNGGSTNSGNMFDFDPVTGNLVSITDLEKHPRGSVVKISSDTWRGLTSEGGADNAGMLYEFNDLNYFSRQIDIASLGSRKPTGDLTEANGTHYGLASEGGEFGHGNIFAIQFLPNVIGYPSPYQLTLSDGIKPMGSLLKASNNILYGVTSAGGANGFGTFFEYDNQVSLFHKEVDFSFSLGGNPQYSKLVELLQVPVAGINALSSPHLCNGNSVVLREYPLTSGNTYQWYKNGIALNGETSHSYTASTAGMYTLKVTNSAGMYAVSGGIYVTVSNTTGAATAGTILCNGGTTTLTATASGGTAPYTYALNGNSSQASNTFTVPAGTYTIVITDYYGCAANTNTITITEPSAITGISTAGSILCHGGTTTITTTGGGGTGTLQYALTGSIGSTFQNSNVYTVPAGTYTVEIKDQNNCIGYANTVIISQPSPLSVSGTFTPILCFGNLSQISLTGSGGTGSYQYKIATPSYQSSNIFSRPAGTWTPEIKDANGCTASGSVLSITQPTPVQVMIPPAYAVNPGGNPFTIYQGYGPSSITLTPIPSGGVGGYSFKWGINTFAGQPYSNSQNLTVSPTQNTNYHLLVKDANGCQTGIVQTVSLVDVRCGPNLNKIEICQRRNNGSFVTNCVNNSSVPNYLNSGSKLGACPTITRSELTGQTQEDVSWNVKVMPNPSNTEFTLLVDSPSEELLNIIITDMAGRQVQRVSAVPNSPFKIGGNYIPGVYIATVMQSGKQKTIKLVKIN